MRENVIEDMRKRIYDYLQQQKELELADIEANSLLTDEEKVASKVEELGLDPWGKRPLLGIGDMEKLLGKKRFKETLGGLVIKPKGKITLAKESDRRKEVTPAELDFAAGEDGKATEYEEKDKEER